MVRVQVGQQDREYYVEGLGEHEVLLCRYDDQLLGRGLDPVEDRAGIREREQRSPVAATTITGQDTGLVTDSLSIPAISASG